MQYVIIGNSAAGLAGAETIRRLDPGGTITIVSDEPHRPYCRPLLTFLLGGEVAEAGMWLHGPDYYRRWNFLPKLGQRVVEVDAAAKRLTLASGETLSYDKLLVASGARPTLPGIPGEDLGGVFTVRVLDHLRQLQERLRPDSRVAVIGSGLVGIKTAQALAHKGYDVTLLARKAQVLSTLLDPTAADILHRALERTGVKLRFGAVPEELVGTGGTISAVGLQGGTEAPADVAVLGIGVVPNVEFLQGAGLADPRGLRVADTLQTAREDIYAAGDCVRPTDCLTGEPTYFAIWPAAVEQGRLAGANMAGQRRTYGGLLAQNSFYVGGTRVIAGGVTLPRDLACEIVCQHDHRRNRYRRLVIKDDRLLGVILTGNVEDAGVYLHLIQNRTPLTRLSTDIRHPDFQVGRLLG